MAMRQYKERIVRPSKELGFTWVYLFRERNKLTATNANIESARSLGRLIGSAKFGIMIRIVAGIDRTEYLKIGETSCLDTCI
jgi:hypothetical protein